MPPTLSVTPAHPADIPDLISIQFSACEDDPYHDALYPGGIVKDNRSASVRADAANRTLSEWRSDRTLQVLKCVDRETGKIVGFAKWNVYAVERPAEEWRKDYPVDWCVGREKEVAERFLGATAAMRRKVWEGRPHLLLNLLCVHRDFQRRGAGTLLVQRGLAKSESLGLPAYLEASPAGYGLYLKLGFHQIDVVDVKAEEYHGPCDRHYVVMLKEAKDLSRLRVKGDLMDSTGTS